MQEQFITVEVAMGSSLEQIQAELRLFRTLQFAITHTWTVYIHHCNSHFKLREDQGLNEWDIFWEGNLSLNSRSNNIIVRFKSNKGIMEHYASVGEKEYLEDLLAVRTKIQHFLEPLIQTP